MNEITDTSSKAEREIAGLTMLATGQPFDVEAQERQGQQELLRSEQLPRKINGLVQEAGDARRQMEALGFVFGEPTDDLFCKATLPEGWSREGSEHAMWSHIVDERGAKRVAIFYKAAFYDRDAFMSLLDVGREVASTWVYADPEARTIPEWLTEEERAEAIEYIENRIKQVEKDVEKYGEAAESWHPRLADHRAFLEAIRAEV